MARARPDLLESAIILSFRSPRQPRTQKGPRRMQQRVGPSSGSSSGTGVGSAGWTVLTLLWFGSQPLIAQYGVVYSLEPIVLNGLTALFALVIKSYANMAIAAGAMLSVGWLIVYCRRCGLAGVSVSPVATDAVMPLQEEVAVAVAVGGRSDEDIPGIAGSDSEEYRGRDRNDADGGAVAGDGRSRARGDENGDGQQADASDDESEDGFEFDLGSDVSSAVISFDESVPQRQPTSQRILYVDFIIPITAAELLADLSDLDSDDEDDSGSSPDFSYFYSHSSSNSSHSRRRRRNSRMSSATAHQAHGRIGSEHSQRQQSPPVQ